MLINIISNSFSYCLSLNLSSRFLKVIFLEKVCFCVSSLRFLTFKRIFNSKISAFPLVSFDFIVTVLLLSILISILLFDLEFLIKLIDFANSLLSKVLSFSIFPIVKFKFFVE